jgi:lysophospholipase L1-like esterase
MSFDAIQSGTVEAERVRPYQGGGLQAVALRVLVLGVSLLMGLGLVEVTLRLAGIKPARPNYGDTFLGFVTKPNLTETFSFPEYGGLLTMKTNNMGFHEDRDTSVLKAPGVTRIVAVGDSQTAGECTNPENYPNILGAQLNGWAGHGKFEVIDAATGRYSPYQYYVKTARQLVQLKPDLLMVGLYIGNDFMDLIRQDDRPYLTREPDGKIEAHRPEFLMYEDPESSPGLLASTRVASLTNQVLGPTLLYQARRARMLWHNAANGQQSMTDVVRYMWEVKRLTDISLGFMTQSMLQQVWFHRFPNTIENALYLNRYVMTQFKELCRNNGIQLTYVIVPTKLAVEPEDMKGVLAEVAHSNPDYTLGRLQAFEDRLTERVLRDCAELGIQAVDLRQPMRERRAGVRLYYPEEMHLNPAGNRVIAGVLFDALARQGLSSKVLSQQ